MITRAPAPQAADVISSSPWRGLGEGRARCAGRRGPRQQRSATQLGGNIWCHDLVEIGAAIRMRAAAVIQGARSRMPTAPNYPILLDSWPEWCANSCFLADHVPAGYSYVPRPAGVCDRRDDYLPFTHAAGLRPAGPNSAADRHNIRAEHSLEWDRHPQPTGQRMP